jgi:hypothetical protein
MKNDVFWDVTPYGSCKSRRFGGTYRHHHQGGKNQGARKDLAVNSKGSTLKRNTVTLLKEEVRFSETSVLTRATQTSQQTHFFVVTAVKTSILTIWVIVRRDNHHYKANTVSIV